MIIGHVRGQELKLDRTTIAADSIKYLEAEFHFAGRDWDGYVKTAYFINGASKFALVLADDRITADMGLNLTAGEWEVKLSGVKGDSRITTTTERIYVREFGGTEITEAEYNALLSEIREKADLVNKLYSGEITIDAVPVDWRDEIQRRVDERIAAEGSAEEQDISAEEALDILLGGAT